MLYITRIHNAKIRLDLPKVMYEQYLRNRPDRQDFHTIFFNVASKWIQKPKYE